MYPRPRWSRCYYRSLCILVLATELHNVISGFSPPYDTAVHYWPLDTSAGLRDVVTNNITGIRDGRVKTLYFKGPGHGYLFIPNSRLKFGRFHDTCIVDPSQCADYLTVSLWIKYTIRQYNVYRKQFFIGTATNKRVDAPGFAIYATPIRGEEERVAMEVNNGLKTWTGHTNVKPDTWTQLGFTWSNTSGLAMIRNCERVQSINAGRLKPTNNTVGDYLYLVKAPGRGKAAFNVSYDDVAVWYSALKQVDEGKICSKKVGPPIVSNRCSSGVTWISVQWKPSLPDYDMLTAFNVWYKYTKSKTWAKQEANNTSISFNITGLVPSSTLEIQIQNKIHGESSNKVYCNTSASFAMSVIERPLNVTIVATSSRAILISWQPPSDNTTVKGYWVLYKGATSDSDITKLEVGLPSNHQFMIAGLTRNTHYKIYVVSVGDFPHVPSRPSELNASTDKDDFHSASSPNVRLVNLKVIQLSWTRPADHSMRYWYRVFMQWSVGKITKSQEIYRGSLTSHTYVSSKELPVSQVKCVVMAMEPNAITTPLQYLTIKSVSWNSAVITWSPKYNVPSEIVDRYHVIITSSSRTVKFVTNNTYVNVAGFKQMTSYRVNIQQGNYKGYGPLLPSDVMFRTSDADECAGINSNCLNPATTLVFDDNQCYDRSLSCSSKARCINTEGSFFCKCNHGYIGDGWLCREIPSETTEMDFCQEESLQEIKWERTLRGRNETAQCPQGITGIAVRQCDGPPSQPAKWGVPDLSGCVSKWALDMSDMANDPSVSASSIADQTAKLTGKTDNIYPGDLKVVVNVLDVLAAREGKVGSADSEETRQFTKSVVNTASNILDPKTIKQWTFIPPAERKSNAGTLINSMDSVALQLARTGNSSRTAMPNVVLDVSSTSQTSKSSDVVIGSNEQTNGQPYAVFPSSELNQGEEPQYITYVSFTTMGSLLAPQSKSNESVNSAVVSLTVSDLKRKELKEPVIVIFAHKQRKDIKKWNSSCVFWDMSSKPGYWSNDGCHVNVTNSSHTVCHCYHLTSFAVLMNVKGDVSVIIKGEHKIALTMITYIGVVLSVTALCLTFVTFLAFRFLKSSRTFIHSNLAFALILAQLLFLFGVNKTKIKLVCQVIAGALHYVWLASFLWMALEGVMLYLMLVKVFGTKTMTRKKRIIFMASGWCAPLIVVAVSAGLYPEGYGTQYYCWLSLDRGFIWAFVGPALLVIAFNFLMMGVTFSVMSRRGGHRRKPSKIRKIRYWAKACTLLTCILGLTWLFGVFYINHQTLFMAYFFTIFNSLQGVFIFMFHCVGDEKIRREYIRLICCRDKGPAYIIASNSRNPKSDDSSSKKSCKTMDTGASSKMHTGSMVTSSSGGHRPVLIMYQKRSSFGPRSSSNQDESESIRSSERLSGEIIENPRDSLGSFSSFRIQNRYSLISRDSDTHDQQSEPALKLQPLGELSIVQEDISNAHNTSS